MEPNLKVQSRIIRYMESKNIVSKFRVYEGEFLDLGSVCGTKDIILHFQLVVDDIITLFCVFCTVVSGV